MDLLRELGARSIPVVSRGRDFVFAQAISDVVAFLGLDEDVGPELTMPELAAKLDMVLAAAARYVAQVPDDRLGDKLPGRDRAYRVLFHHIFNIADATISAMESGEPVNYEALTAPPPDDMQTVADIVAYGEEVRRGSRAGGSRGRSRTRWTPITARTRCMRCSSAPHGIRPSMSASSC